MVDGVFDGVVFGDEIDEPVRAGQWGPDRRRERGTCWL